MQLFATLLIVAGTFIVPFYFHALIRFRRILLTERPDLADRRGSLSFFYNGMPRIADPNVSMAVIGAAFSSVARELHDPSAMRYARRIKFCILVVFPANLLAFSILILGAP